MIPLRVLVYSSQQAVLTGLSATLDRQSGHDGGFSVATIRRSDDLYRAVVRHRAHVVVWHVSDNHLPPAAPDLPPVGLISAAEERDLHGAAIMAILRRGNRGIVSITNDLDGMGIACRRASARQPYLSPTLVDLLVTYLSGGGKGPAAGAFGLSARETEVLRHLSNGKSPIEIAATLNSTERTVRYYLSQIYRKLGVRNRLEAVVRAYQDGLAV